MAKSNRQWNLDPPTSEEAGQQALGYKRRRKIKIEESEDTDDD